MLSITYIYILFFLFFIFFFIQLIFIWLCVKIAENHIVKYPSGKFISLWWNDIRHGKETDRCRQILATTTDTYKCSTRRTYRKLVSFVVCEAFKAMRNVIDTMRMRNYTHCTMHRCRDIDMRYVDDIFGYEILEG